MNSRYRRTVRPASRGGLHLCFGLAVASLGGGGSLLEAQGLVVFGNLGVGVNSPVCNAWGRTLGAGFFAQLQFADGTNIGAPAQFLANGYFSDGVREVDGFLSGETVALQVAVLSDDGLRLGFSDLFNVTLGGGGTPPIPPSYLSGMRTFYLPRNEPLAEPFERYEWTNPYVDSPETIICQLVNDSSLPTVIVVEPDCACAHLPFPGPADSERLMKPCFQVAENDESLLRIAIQPDGVLELRWPTSMQLVRRQNLTAGSILPEKPAFVVPDRSDEGSNIKKILADEQQMFYWVHRSPARRNGP